MDAERIQQWSSPQTILVATNLADEGALVYQAASQARESGAKVLLVHALRPSSLQSTFDPLPSSPITGSREAAAWHVLHRMARMMEWQGATCEPVLLEGEPVEKIPELVKARGADRVIVATRSARGLDRLIAGSVAEGLMDQVKVPVCMVGPRVKANPFRGMRAGCVLLALSLNHERADCVEFAASLAIRRQAKLTVIHVLDAGATEETEKEAARGVAHSAVVAVVNSIHAPLPLTEIVIRDGPAVRAILEEHVCPGPDFIVMGSPSLSVLSKLLGSSVVHGVISGAGCPVITLRAGGSREWERTERDAEARFLEKEELAVRGINR